MLVLDDAGDGYPDHADSEVRYRLPVGLEPVTDAHGKPQALLASGTDRGVLQLRLGAIWPELAARERRAPLGRGRFRLVLRTPAARETSSWWSSAVAGSMLVDRSVSLGAVEHALARHLGSAGAELVDVEVEVEIRGFGPTFPWIARAPGETLRDRLAALLSGNRVDWTAVEDAFNGLGVDTFEWVPLEPRAIPPPASLALAAAASAARGLLVDRVGDDQWAVRDEVAEHVNLSLEVPRVQTRRFGLTWSFSEFLRGADDPSQYFADLSVPAPFEATDLFVVNDVPLADDGIRVIAFEARTGGPTGLVRHEFVPGASSSARLRFIRETFTDAPLTWRATATVSTARGPAVVETDFRSGDLMIEIDRASLGLSPIRLAADLTVFDVATAVELEVKNRTIVLTPDKPVAWAVGRDPPETVPATVVLKPDQREPIGSLPVEAGEVRIHPSHIGVGEARTVAISPPADLATKAAYLAVQIEGGPWRTLDPDATIQWPVRFAHAFATPSLRYRTRHVPLAEDGSTAVMVESEWRDTAGTAIGVVV